GLIGAPSTGLNMNLQRLVAIAAFCFTAAFSADSREPELGIDLTGMDKAVAPGDDFFAYTNGTWLKTTEIPADKAAYGAGGIVFDTTTHRTEELIQEAGRANAPHGSAAQKIGDYYASYRDEAGIEAKGLKPLQPTLDRINAIGDRKSLARYLGTTL